MKKRQLLTTAIMAFDLMAVTAHTKTDKPNILLIWGNNMGPLNLNNTIPAGL